MTNGTNADKAETLGLECPGCGCMDLRVYYTRKVLGGILRVRICRNCDRKIPCHERAQ